MVPPTDVVHLTVSYIVNYENYVFVAAEKWIYVYDGNSFKALYFWKAHHQNIKGLAVFQEKIWSFCNDNSDIRIWMINLDDLANFSLRQMSFHVYSSNLLFAMNIDDHMWCFYEDSNLCVINCNLKLLFSAKWIEGSNLTLISCRNNRILMLCDKLLLGLTRPSQETQEKNYEC